MFHRPENDGKTERKVGKLLGRTSWFRPATKNNERGHLSNCCNPYTDSRLVNKGSEAQLEISMGGGGGHYQGL